MYRLEESYGKRTFEIWNAEQPRDLRGTQTDTETANRDVWCVASFRDLIEGVAFLGSMNKRLTLFYRGQTRNVDPLPMLFRESWPCFDSGHDFAINTANRKSYWDALQGLGQHVYKICDSEELGLPRWRGLRDIREVQWAVVQHYQLWPTPLIDLTSSLRAAASFAMDFRRGEPDAPRTGFVYVVGMPHSTGSISYDIDQQLVLARLQSACPPVAKRPHYQEAFLAGRFPIYQLVEGLVEKSSLIRRLIAKFELRDAGQFWNEDFPLVGERALLPDEDPLLERFLAEFGKQGGRSLHPVASQMTR
jgi:FRG domain